MASSEASYQIWAEICGEEDFHYHLISLSREGNVRIGHMEMYVKVL
jgi:hypothetical protein